MYFLVVLLSMVMMGCEEPNPNVYKTLPRNPEIIVFQDSIIKTSLLQEQSFWKSDIKLVFPADWKYGYYDKEGKKRYTFLIEFDPSRAKDLDELKSRLRDGIQVTELILMDLYSGSGIHKGGEPEDSIFNETREFFKLYGGEIVEYVVREM